MDAKYAPNPPLNWITGLRLVFSVNNSNKNNQFSLIILRISLNSNDGFSL